MIGIHSVFSSPYRHHVYNINHPVSLVELYTWVYSILTWKRDGHKLFLYCDQQIEDFVKYYGFGDLYDEIRVRNYDDDIHECFWSYNKIRVIEEFAEPICLFDIDVFFRDTEFTKWHKDMICHHYELLEGVDEFSKIYNSKDDFKSLSFYENIDENFKMVNASVLVFNSYDLKIEFLKNAKEVVNNIKDIQVNSHLEWDSYTIFMEQINLGYLNRKYHCDSVSGEWKFTEYPVWNGNLYNMTKVDGSMITEYDYRVLMNKMYGNFYFDSKYSVAHLSVHKSIINIGNETRRLFYEQILKEKIIEEGYSKFSKLFTLTQNENNTEINSLIPKRIKPFNRYPKNTVTKYNFTEWFGKNINLLKDDRFNVAFWGSIGGKDIDIVISKKDSVTILDVQKYMMDLIYSGDELNISVEVLYISDIDYIKEFRLKNSKKVYEDILIGFISEYEYESIGKNRRYDKLVFYYGPFNDAYYKCSNKYDDILFIDDIVNIKDNDGYTHFSSEVYNTIYERFGIFSLIE